MSKVPYSPPAFNETGFNCPFCQAFAKQNWYQGWTENNHRIDGLNVSFCTHCGKYAVWRAGALISPGVVTVEPPNLDMAPDIQDDYREAADIMSRSPRGSAALLRLALQKLCDGQLKAHGATLDEQIADLVARGLPIRVQQSLDSLRVIGNEAVHPGTLDLKDDKETASALFGLINFIVEQLISQPKQIEAIYEKLPASKKEGIKKRDGATA